VLPNAFAIGLRWYWSANRLLWEPSDHDALMQMALRWI
jgi:hypothetical protein